MIDAFHQGLKETGYIEGQNVAFKHRAAGGEYDRFQVLADDLVRRGSRCSLRTEGRPRPRLPKQRHQRFPSSFTSAVIRCNKASSRASLDPAATSPALASRFCARVQTTGTASGVGAACRRDRYPHESEQSRQRIRDARLEGCCTLPWLEPAYVDCQW
jgi:hypothetical protein